jgi:hypothetical protein
MDDEDLKQILAALVRIEALLKNIAWGMGIREE